MIKINSNKNKYFFNKFKEQLVWVMKSNSNIIPQFKHMGE